MSLSIRPYRLADRADVYDVCVRTGAAGQDASGRYSSEDLLPDVFAGPYVDLEPESAWVVDDGSRVIGYIIAAADTSSFVRVYRERWLPGFAAKYAAGTEADAPIIRMGLDPERMLVPEVASYPAHLHIDLLPQAQGHGLGRALVDTLRADLHRRGVPALHLTMDPANTNARAFYDRLGFVELPSGALGIATGPDDA